MSVLTALLLAAPLSTAAQPTYESSVLPTGVPDGATGTNVLEDAPRFFAPAGADGTLGTADDDYRPNHPTGSPLVDFADPGPIGTTLALNGQVQTRSAWDAGAFESHGEALPVELAGLSGRFNDGAVRLQWRTLSERQNAGFRIQRQPRPAPTSSADAEPAPTEWTTVDRVDGGGTTDEPHSYRFVDDTLPYDAERLRYRLVQVDADGTTNTSDPVTVERPAPNRLRLDAPVPNPARQRATIRYRVPPAPDAPDATLTVHDALGRQLTREPVPVEPAARERVRLDVGSWSSGTYFVRLRVGATVRTQRLVVVK